MIETYEYGKFSPEHLEKIKKGIELYNNRDYWDCHEYLEDHWIDDVADTARNVYWAVIQVATILYHYERDNIAGVRGMLAKSKEKFQRCIDMKIENDLMFNYLSWKEFRDLVMGMSREMELQDCDELYQFKFKNPNDWEI